MSDWQERLRHKLQDIEQRKGQDMAETKPLPVTTEEDGTPKDDSLLSVVPGGWMVMLGDEVLSSGSKNAMVAQARAEGDERKLDTLVYNADGTKGRKYYHS